MVSASHLEDTIRVWDVDAGTLLRTIHVEGVVALAGSHSHSFIVATRDLDHAITLDVERGRFFHLPVCVKAAAFVSDGRSFITGCWSEEGLWTWDLGNLLKARALEANDHETRRAGGIEVSRLEWWHSDGPQVIWVFLSSRGC